MGDASRTMYMTTKYILGQLGENGKPRTIEVEQGETLERSVGEYIEQLELLNKYSGSKYCISCGMTVDGFKQILQAERQKREDIWKCTVDILEDIKEFSGGTDSELETYIDEQIQALTQPNNPK